MSDNDVDDYDRYNHNVIDRDHDYNHDNHFDYNHDYHDGYNHDDLSLSQWRHMRKLLKRLWS